MAKLRARAFFKNSMFTLIAVESVDTWHGNTNMGCQLYGGLAPVAVIVCSPNETYALDMEARPVDLDRFRTDLPGLGTLLNLKSSVP